MTELPSDWQQLFQRLERDRDASARRADKLQASLDRMTTLLAKQGEELTAIRKMLRRREQQLVKAQRENRKLRRQLGLDDPDPEPEAEAAPTPPPDKAAAESGSQAEVSSKDEGAPKATAASSETEDGDETSPAKAPRKGGRRPPPDHLPGVEERHNVCACAHCSGRVLKRDVLESEVFSVVNTHVRRRVILRERVLCANPACGQPTTAPMPPMPCERALFDCSFIAWLVTMKFAYLMPLDRIRDMLFSQGVVLSIGTLVHLIERATSLAEAVDGEHMRQLKAGKYVCFDGTGLKVLMPGQVKAWDGYLEVYTCAEVTVFQFDLTKHADELRERLSALTAVLMTDAESRNKAGAPGAVFAHCNAHVVRAFEDAERAQPILAREGRDFLDVFYALEEEAKRLGLQGDALKAYRQRGLSTLERYRTWLEDIAGGDLPPSDLVRKIAAYCLRHWEGLTRFMDDPDIPLDNNEAEREFQRHAKLRYASLFAGSEEGAHRWATLLGIVRTAQKHGLDVQAYLTWMFERRGTHRKRFGLTAAKLTPAAYKAAGSPGRAKESVPLAA